MRSSVAGWVIWLAVGIVTAGLGAALLVVGLDDADKYASVVGGGSAVVGLGVSLSALVRRQSHRPPPRESPAEIGPRQTVASSTIGGDVLQIRGTQGNIRIRGVSAPSEAGDSRQEQADPLGIPASGQQGTQSVTDSRIAGSATQIGHVGGEVEIQRTSDG